MVQIFPEIRRFLKIMVQVEWLEFLQPREIKKSFIILQSKTSFSRYRRKITWIFLATKYLHASHLQFNTERTFILD